jgi:hypothetical protein
VVGLVLGVVVLATGGLVSIAAFERRRLAHTDVER